MNNFFSVDLIFFIMIAAFLILRLRRALGRRTGNEKKTGSVFSFDAKVIDKNSKNIELKCLSVHIGSQILDHKPYEKMLKSISEILRKIKYRFKLTLFRKILILAISLNIIAKNIPEIGANKKACL